MLRKKQLAGKVPARSIKATKAGKHYDSAQVMARADSDMGSETEMSNRSDAEVPINQIHVGRAIREHNFRSSPHKKYEPVLKSTKREPEKSTLEKVTGALPKYQSLFPSLFKN